MLTKVSCILYLHIISVAIICVPAKAALTLKGGVKYIAIVDAGSSGSRIYLYGSDSNKRKFKVRDLMDFKSVAPALSSFKSNPAEAGIKSIGPLLQRLENYLIKKRLYKNQVEVEILATAGMRLIDRVSQSAIFESARQYIVESGFLVGDIETIPGSMEGLYSWVDVNYLLGRLQKNRKTVGVIEIGGASAQVSFEIEKSNASGQIITVNNQNYRIFTTSILGLGRNEARRRMYESSQTRAKDKGESCYPQGLFFEGYNGGLNEESGHFDYISCKTKYANVLNQFNLKDIRRQLLDSSRDFASVGTGNPFGTVWGLIEAWKIQSANPNSILEQIEIHCGRSWSDFSKQFGSSEFNKSQCADSVFVDSFLFGESGLRLPKDSVTSYKFINGLTPTWTRGAFITKYVN